MSATIVDGGSGGDMANNNNRRKVEFCKDANANSDSPIPSIVVTGDSGWVQRIGARITYQFWSLIKRYLKQYSVICYLCRWLFAVGAMAETWLRCRRGGRARSGSWARTAPSSPWSRSARNSIRWWDYQSSFWTLFWSKLRQFLILPSDYVHVHLSQDSCLADRTHVSIFHTFWPSSDKFPWNMLQSDVSNGSLIHWAESD